MTIMATSVGDMDALFNEMIEAHRLWLTTCCSAKTTYEAVRFLRRLHRELPYGLPCAADDELVAWLGSDPDWSRQTRQTYRGHIVRFFGWAAGGTDPWLDYDPSVELPKISVPRGTPRPATAEQMTWCVTQAAQPVRRMCLLATFAGMRPHEIAQRTRADVTVERISIRGKGGKTRQVPTHPLIWADVEGLPPGPLFRRPDGRPADAEWLSKVSRVYLGRHLGITLYNLRHWFGTNTLRAEGSNLRVVQTLMGHSSPATTAVYTMVADDQLRSAIAALPAP